MVHLEVKGLFHTAQQCELIKEVVQRMGEISQEMMCAAVQGFPDRLKAIVNDILVSATPPASEITPARILFP